MVRNGTKKKLAEHAQLKKGLSGINPKRPLYKRGAKLPP